MTDNETRKGCADEMITDTLALINRQKETIEQLQTALFKCGEEAVERQETINRLNEELDLAKKAIIALTEERMKLLDNSTACDSCSCELLDARDKAIRESHRLADDNESLKRILDCYALQYGSAVDKERFLKPARAEAVKEFAEKLKPTLSFCRYTSAEDIDNLVKEFTEGG